jgi:hypothetical protein
MEEGPRPRRSGNATTLTTMTVTRIKTARRRRRRMRRVVLMVLKMCKMKRRLSLSLPSAMSPRRNETCQGAAKLENAHAPTAIRQPLLGAQPLHLERESVKMRMKIMTTTSLITTLQVEGILLDLKRTPGKR